MPITTEQADRLDVLRSMPDGWCGHGLGDAPRTPALTAAQNLLDVLTESEQHAWFVAPEADGGLRFERDDIPGDTHSLFFVDIDHRGALTLVWFDDTHHQFERRFTGTAAVSDLAVALVNLVDSAYEKARTPALASA